MFRIIQSVLVRKTIDTGLASHRKAGVVMPVRLSRIAYRQT